MSITLSRRSLMQLGSAAALGPIVLSSTPFMKPNTLRSTLGHPMTIDVTAEGEFSASFALWNTQHTIPHYILVGDTRSTTTEGQAFGWSKDGRFKVTIETGANKTKRYRLNEGMHTLSVCGNTLHITVRSGDHRHCLNTGLPHTEHALSSLRV